MKKIRTLISLVTGLVAGGLLAAELADRTKDADFNKPESWNPTGVPVAGNVVHLRSTRVGDPITVALSESVSCVYNLFTVSCVSGGGLHFAATDGQSLTLPAATGEERYSATPFKFYHGNGDNTMIVSSSGRSTVDPVVEMSNPEFVLKEDGNGSMTLDFTRGTYDFLEPEDVKASNTVTFCTRLAATFSPEADFRTHKLTVSGADVLFKGPTRAKGTTYVEYGRLTFGGTNDVTLGTIDVKNSGAASSRLIVDGSTVKSSGALSVIGSDSAFIMSNGVFSCSTSGYVGGGSNGRLVVAGGSFSLVGGDNIQVGNSGGNGTIELSGGTFTTGRIRLSRSTATEAYSTKFIQTGGTYTDSAGIQFQQSCTGNNKGVHSVVLDGGLFKSFKIFRDATVTAGTAYLSADGGTWQPTAASTATLTANLSYGEFGAKGLTLDSHGNNYTLDLVGRNKTDAEGLLTKTGEGTLTLKTTDWKVARTVVAKGTLKPSDDTTLETTLVVTNGAVFSLAGATANLTVSSLAITNGVLELDPGDTITVTGNFDFQGLKLSWTSLPEDEQSFLVVSGELTEQQKKAIRRLYYENAMATGKHAEFAVQYDEQSGMTTVKTKVADDTPLTETAVWTGSGAWATAENWQDSVKPTEMKKAVFGADAAGTEVEIAAGDLAGALSFTGGNYRLFGEALAIEGYLGAAEIDVEAGSQTIDAPLELNASTPIQLASGAELALNGRIGYGGLDKSGRGRLTLGGTLALGGQGFISRDGLVTVTNATALGATSADVAKFAAGTLEFAHPDGEPMTINAAVSGAAEETGKTTLVFKVESDATLKNFANTNNRLLKRGAGVLTLDFDEARTITGLMSADLDTTSNIGCTYPADGSEPSGYRFPFGIAEGELKLVGRGEAPVTVTSRAKTLVGLPTEEAESSAAILTLDNVKFVSSDYSFYIGYQTGSATYKNRKAIVRILNGSTLQVSAGVVVGYSSSYAAGRCQVMMTNGTYRIVAADGSLSRGGLASGQTANVEYLMNKSSFIVKTSIVTDGSTYMDADNGSYFGGENRTPMVLKYNNQNHARIYGELFFHNGSTLALSEIEETKDPNGKRSRDLVFVFDDAEWIYDAACGDKTWPVAVEGHNKYEMRGRGVILKPAAGKTFETLEPFIGEGGVVNAGEGTVKFGEGAYQCAGTLEITEPAGTIDVSADDGTTHAIIPVKGKGTLKGAKATHLVVKADAEDDWSGISAPTLEDCTAWTVVIDMGRTAENPMSGTFPQNIAVAKWTGTGAVPAFKLRNTGLRNVGADFTVDPDGTVRMTPHEVGIVLIVR